MQKIWSENFPPRLSVGTKKNIDTLTEHHFRELKKIKKDFLSCLLFNLTMFFYFLFFALFPLFNLMYTFYMTISTLTVL